MRYQGGAIGLSLALMLLSLVLLSAFAVDAARLFFHQRQLQAQADLAALAMARSACYIDGATHQATLEALARANLDSNGFDLDQGVATFTFGTAGIDNNHWQLGAAGADYRPAAQVGLALPRPASLLAGGLWGQQVTLRASALVHRQMAVGFGLGTGVVDVDMGNSLLSALLGGEVSAVSYQGLAAASLGLGSLLSAADANGLLSTDLEVGTVDEVLASEVGLADLLQASIDALNQEGTTDADITAAMVELEDAARVGGLTLTLADFLQLATATETGMTEAMQRAALATRLDLYGLVRGAALAANRGNAVAVPGLAADLGIAGLELQLRVIEPPQYTVGLLPAASPDPWIARAETAQLELDLRATLLPGGLDLGLIALDETSLGLHVDAARGETRLLDAAGCNLANSEVRLDFATTPSVATLVAGDGGVAGDPLSSSDPQQPLSIGAEVSLTLVSVPVVVNVGIDLPVGGQTTLTHQVVLQRQPLPYTEENISPGLAPTLASTLSGMDIDIDVDVLGSSLLDGVLGSVLDLLDAQLLPLVSTLVNQLTTSVVDPVLRALGVTVGYADVIVVSVDLGDDGLID